MMMDDDDMAGSSNIRRRGDDDEMDEVEDIEPRTGKRPSRSKF